MLLKITSALILIAPLASANWATHTLKNDQISLDIVPSIGRIMSLQLIGNPNILWHDTTLTNIPADPQSEKWQNFGGEKVWPAPEKDWSQYGPRTGWRPPTGIDATPARITSSSDELVVLTWPDDPLSGIRMTRTYTLSEATLSITTSFYRFQPGPAPLAIWTVAQLTDPELCFLEKTPDCCLPKNLILLSKDSPPSLKEQPNSFSLTRHPSKAFKIATAGTQLIWGNAHTILHITTNYTPGSIQPDAGSRIQIYTNADAKPYVELETLSPLSTIPVNSSLTHTTRYTLIPRDPETPLEETAKTILSKPNN